MGGKWINKRVLGNVMREAKKRGAPVFRIDKFTKGDKFRSLVFTILSARTKDETTIRACRKLFAKIKGPRGLAKMGAKKTAKLIYGVGFYNSKSRHIVRMAKKLVQDYNGKVPDEFDGLIKLPGVGRKTANVVLAHGFGKDAIGVDVHVHRISNRMGLVRTKRPEQTEERLKKIVPRNLWKHWNIALVSHGQTTCLPRVPFCSRCVIRQYCKRIGVKRNSCETHALTAQPRKTRHSRPSLSRSLSLPHSSRAS